MIMANAKGFELLRMMGDFLGMKGASIVGNDLYLMLQSIAWNFNRMFLSATRNARNQSRELQLIHGTVRDSAIATTGIPTTNAMPESTIAVGP
jgi:hypothetical protein